MLIKAKERKTLVSPAEGVASREMAGPPPHQLLSRLLPRQLRGRHRHRWRATTATGIGIGIGIGIGTDATIPGRACARIFIPRELRRLYSLPVVLRYKAYARSAATTWLLATAPPLREGGEKMEAGQDHRRTVASRKPARFTALSEPNPRSRPDEDRETLFSARLSRATRHEKTPGLTISLGDSRVRAEAQTWVFANEASKVADEESTLRKISEHEEPWRLRRVEIEKVAGRYRWRRTGAPFKSTDGSASADLLAGESAVLAPAVLIASKSLGRVGAGRMPFPEPYAGRAERAIKRGLRERLGELAGLRGRSSRRLLNKDSDWRIALWI
ncbi:hypothetical protein KM043_000812 [Ampulex compressa]|nr:hypothetical protein KM043_000812 [Ampulex compressa]